MTLGSKRRAPPVTRPSGRAQIVHSRPHTTDLHLPAACAITSPRVRLRDHWTWPIDRSGCVARGGPRRLGDCSEPPGGLGLSGSAYACWFGRIRLRQRGAVQPIALTGLSAEKLPSFTVAPGLGCGAQLRALDHLGGAGAGVSGQPRDVLDGHAAVGLSETKQWRSSPGRPVRRAESAGRGSCGTKVAAEVRRIHR